MSSFWLVVAAAAQAVALSPRAHKFAAVARQPLRSSTPCLGGLAESQALLTQYDADHRAAATSPGAIGLGGAKTANEWSLGVERKPLASAVRSLRRGALESDDGRIMLGICADDAQQGIGALKAWVGALELPRGVLHGCDKDGVALDMTDFGPVYIKYNSKPVGEDAGGSAVLSGYAGDFRGVYFNPELNDGAFRQYAVLPLDLFESTPAQAGGQAAAAAPAPASAAPSSTAGGLSRESISTALAPLLPALAELGGSVEVLGLSAEAGLVRLEYDGPSKLRYSLELALRALPGVSAVQFVQPVSAAQGGEASRAAATAAAAAGTPHRFSSRSAPPGAPPLETLHTQGYVILPEAHMLPHETIEQIRASAFEPIFNGHAEGEDPLRFQGRSFGWASAVERVFERALEEAGMLRCEDGVSKRVVNDCYCLRSLPCAESADVAMQLGRQPAHSDAPEPPAGSLADLADMDMPLSAMLSIQQGTCIWVYPEGCGQPERCQPVQLEVGDMLVWRGDLVHAGAGYAEEHFRLHAYVDPPADVYRRPKAQTHRCAPAA